MSFLCKVCGQSVLDNEFEYMKYLTTMRKKNDKSLYKKYTIININLDEIDKILNDYVTIHNDKI